MNRRVVLVLLGLLYALPVLGYDAVLAERFQQFYAPFAGKDCAKSLQMMPPEAFVKAVQGDRKPFVLDVRTEQEAALYGITLTDSLRRSMQEVFAPDTLARLPTDRPIVVVCKSGARATAIAMGLRQIGFANTYVLKGGLAKLAAYVDPKTAH